MTNRNDELLLALGWEMRRHGSLGNLWRTKDEAEAGIPFAESKFTRSMRPYDNLQDAVDCVPEGHGYTIDHTDPDKVAAFVFKRGDTVHADHFQVNWKFADTPAEALSEAILKAVGNTRKEAGHE